MGGIVAMFSEGGSVHPERLERATRSLDHRGPDGRRCWVDAARTIGLGHTRLGTIDLAGGRQPIANEDESIRAVVDGELYDFARIRDGLIARGHRFRTHSDSELLVHLYEDHGTACVEHLRGEFAFALYDGRRDLLIAGRDRCGVKPVVYGRCDGVLILASEAKALLAAGLPAAWDIESFLASSLIGGPLEDATMFAGIHRLPAGHLLVVSRSHHRLVRYWDFDYPARDSSPQRSEADDREAVAEALDEAVRLRLRADLPVACCLGGLDSCTVFGLANRHLAAPLPAFILTFGPTPTEETALAYELAVRAGATYVSAPLHRERLAQDLDEVVYAAERPLANIGSVLLYQLGRAVREAGFKIVLSGEGADEIFAGYAHYLRDLAIASRTPQLGAAGRVGAASVADGNPQARRISTKPIRTALGFVPTWIQAMVMRGQGLLGLLRPDLADRLARGEPVAGLVSGLEVSRQLLGRHPVHQSMYLWSKSVLPGYLLSANNDAIQMAHGVECRMPFLDHRVVDLSTRLPIDRLIRGGVEKYLLREVARPVVTEAVYRRPKDRAIAPELTLLETGLVDELLHDTLRGPVLSSSPLFDRASVVALLDALPASDPVTRAALNAPLMLILTACLMQQSYRIGNAR